MMRGILKKGFVLCVCFVFLAGGLFSKELTSYQIKKVYYSYMSALVSHEIIKAQFKGEVACTSEYISKLFLLGGANFHSKVKKGQISPYYEYFKIKENLKKDELLPAIQAELLAWCVNVPALMENAMYGYEGDGVTLHFDSTDRPYTKYLEHNIKSTFSPDLKPYLKRLEAFVLSDEAYD